MDKSGRSDGYVLLPSELKGFGSYLVLSLSESPDIEKSLAEMGTNDSGTSEPVFLVAGV